MTLKRLLTKNMTPEFKFDEPSKENPFKVPDGYFENFSARIDHKIAEQKISLWTKIRPLTGIAAMFIAFVAVGSYFIQSIFFQDVVTQTIVAKQERVPEQIILDEISEDALIDYILANAD